VKITFSDGCGSSTPYHTVTIGPHEPFLIVKLGICFLQPISSPGGCTADHVFKKASHNYVFHADKRQFDEFCKHMDVSYPGWDERFASEDGKDIYGRVVPEPGEDDASDRGVKTPVQNMGNLDELLDSLEVKKDQGRRAIEAAQPQRDIVHERKAK